jgi:hypothetical protein
MKGTSHAPGVVCILTGGPNAWYRKDNGRLVKIDKLRRVSTKNGNIWRVEVKDEAEGPLHVYIDGPFGAHPSTAFWTNVGQSYLIPLGPEGQFDEQTVGREVGDGEPCAEPVQSDAIAEAAIHLPHMHEDLPALQRREGSKWRDRVLP